MLGNLVRNRFIRKFLYAFQLSIFGFFARHSFVFDGCEKNMDEIEVVVCFLGLFRLHSLRARAVMRMHPVV